MHEKHPSNFFLNPQPVPTCQSVSPVGFLHLQSHSHTKQEKQPKKKHPPKKKKNTFNQLIQRTLHSRGQRRFARVAAAALGRRLAPGAQALLEAAEVLETVTSRAQLSSEEKAAG